MSVSQRKKARQTSNAEAVCCSEQAERDCRILHVTKASFDAVKTLVTNATDFDELFANALSTQALSHLCHKEADCGQSVKNLALSHPALKASELSATTFASVREGMKLLHNAFRVLVVIELMSLGAVHLHTFERECSYRLWERLIVNDVLTSLFDKAGDLRTRRLAFIKTFFGVLEEWEEKHHSRHEVILRRDDACDLCNRVRGECVLKLRNHISDVTCLVLDGPGFGGRILASSNHRVVPIDTQLVLGHDGKSIEVEIHDGLDVFCASIEIACGTQRIFGQKQYLEEVHRLSASLQQLDAKLESELPGIVTNLKMCRNRASFKIIQGNVVLTPKSLVTEQADEHGPISTGTSSTQSLKLRWNVVMSSTLDVSD